MSYNLPKQNLFNNLLDKSAKSQYNRSHSFLHDFSHFMMNNNIITTNETYLTPRQAAGILNVSLSTLKKLIYSGKIRTIKTPGGHHRINRENLLRPTSNHLSSRIKPAFSSRSLFAMASGFVYLLESRLIFCKGHSSKVAEISLSLAKKMNFSSSKQQRVYLAALLHDIGKFLISESILNKHDQLSQIEYEELKKHPLVGGDFLSTIESLKDLAPIVKQHHERFDGAGYPEGLKANAILPEARIISLAEAFACMTAKDSYSKTFDVSEAIGVIEKNANTQFDPQITEVFLKIYRDGKSSKPRGELITCKS
jgi:excisionase family DNA binding protein